MTSLRDRFSSWYNLVMIALLASHWSLGMRFRVIARLWDESSSSDSSMEALRTDSSLTLGDTLDPEPSMMGTRVYRPLMLTATARHDGLQLVEEYIDFSTRKKRAYEAHRCLSSKMDWLVRNQRRGGAMVEDIFKTF